MTLFQRILVLEVVEITCKNVIFLLNCKHLNYGTAEQVDVLIAVLSLTLMDFLAVSPKPPPANLIENKKKPFQSSDSSISCLYCAIRIMMIIMDLKSNSPKLVI